VDIRPLYLPLGCVRMEPFELEEATVSDASRALRDGTTTSAELTAAYLARIEQVDRGEAGVRAVLEINPDAIDIAHGLDVELQRGVLRGPLHGMPILIKDNIDTADSMLTTAGSLALVQSRPRSDAACARRLRDAGAVILGKTNLSEWANFRSTASTSGWSARGGQTQNPYVLDRSPCGSSSGSAAAVSANLAMAALGTETDGSIMCPSSVCGVVGIKPTLGLVSTAGVIPIAHSQDTVGVHGRTVADAAALLQVIAEPDGANAPRDYVSGLRSDALRGAHIGVLRQQFCGYSPAADALFADALVALHACRAVLEDPALLPSAEELVTSTAELTVLCHEFHADLNAYLAARGDPTVRSLEDVIAFNRAHAGEEMPVFGQEHMEAAVGKAGLDDPEYLAARAECVRLGRTEGLDAVLDAHGLDALVSVTGGPAWTRDHINGDHHLGSSSGPAAMAGYPAVTVPMGMVAGELPVGITFIGRAFSDTTLIGLAYAFEQATRARRRPRLLPTLTAR
jgi:amidase